VLGGRGKVGWGGGLVTKVIHFRNNTNCLFLKHPHHQSRVCFDIKFILQGTTLNFIPSSHVIGCKHVKVGQFMIFVFVFF
jgi:hypothetical protein